MLLIAKSNERSKRAMLKVAHMLALALIGLSTVSCTSSLDLFGGAKVDRSLSTSAVPTAASTTTALSDEATVRNAVTSADLAKIGEAPLPWANAATGSAGVVSTIKEARNQGQVCREFTTTRHSYDGIAMFSGQACLTGSGDWLLTAFNRQ